MSTHTFVLNGRHVSVDCPGNLRLLWVLRDLLGIHGPKYGCGLEVCKACTCHINGQAFSPCAVPVRDLTPTDEITTIASLYDHAPETAPFLALNLHGSGPESHDWLLRTKPGRTRWSRVI